MVSCIFHKPFHLLNVLSFSKRTHISFNKTIAKSVEYCSQMKQTKLQSYIVIISRIFTEASSKYHITFKSIRQSRFLCADAKAFY